MQYRKAFPNIFTHVLAVKLNKNYLNAFPHFLTMLSSRLVHIDSGIIFGKVRTIPWKMVRNC